MCSCLCWAVAPAHLAFCPVCTCALHSNASATRIADVGQCSAQVSGDGQVLESFMDPTGKHLHSVSSILDVGGQLFLGNLFSDSVASVKL